jgi:hypothetical protein
LRGLTSRRCRISASRRSWNCHIWATRSVRTATAQGWHGQPTGVVGSTTGVP